MSTLWIAIALALLVVGALLGRWLARLWQGLVLARRRKHGRDGELAARALLEGAGYRVLQDQLTRQCEVLVDGTPQRYTIRADYLVSRDGKRYVAEVKTGAKAPAPTYPQTRRQLLEYAHCYPVDGVLLVDMQAGRLHTIEWESVTGAAPPARWRALLRPVAIAVAVGLLAGLLLGLLLGAS